MPGAPDALLGLSDALGAADTVSTLDERVNDLNAVMRALAAGATAFSMVSVTRAGAARVRLSDTTAAVSNKNVEISSLGGVAYFRARNDDWSAVLKELLQFQLSNGNAAFGSNVTAPSAEVGSAAAGGIINMRDGTAGADLKLWRLYTAAGATYLQVLNDNYTVKKTVATINHTNGRMTFGDQASDIQSGLAAFLTSGDALEWGHTNPAGFRCHLGSESGSGKPVIMFNCQTGTNPNTYKTLAIKGFVIRAELDGGVTLGRVNSTNTDNQALTSVITIASDGTVTYAVPPQMPNATVFAANSSLLDFFSSAQAANMKRSRIMNQSGRTVLQTVDDGYSVANDVWSADHATQQLTFAKPILRPGAGHTVTTLPATGTAANDGLELWWRPSGTSGGPQFLMRYVHSQLAWVCMGGSPYGIEITLGADFTSAALGGARQPIGLYYDVPASGVYEVWTNFRLVAASGAGTYDVYMQKQETANTSQTDVVSLGGSYINDGNVPIHCTARGLMSMLTGAGNRPRISACLTGFGAVVAPKVLTNSKLHIRPLIIS